MLTETFALESYPEPGTRATRTISSRLRDDFRPSECGRKRLFVICAVIFLAAVFVFLIAAELMSAGIAVVAGILAALSPQFAYYSVLLLPDSLAVLPILIAVYFLIRAIRHPRLLSFALAGVFIGLSCWLRANALLLAPILACLVPLMLARGRRLRYSLALVSGAAILIAPITIKNAIVFHRLIPLSLGAGQKLLDGIAEYDQGRFGIPKTDLGIMRQEAAMYQRPNYAMVL